MKRARENFFEKKFVSEEELEKNFFEKKIENKKLEILKRPRARSSITNMPKIDYINTHPYMFSGRVEPISLLVKSEILSDTIEFFGKDIRLVNQPDGRIKVDFKSATAGIYEWALQHGDMCEVLYPQELRDKIRSTIYKMKQTYYKTTTMLITQLCLRQRTQESFLLSILI